jgi:hypothetical protein
MFKMALDLTPSDRELCSQSTISRLENLPDARALLRMSRAMVDLYCESFGQVPKRITLDVDDTFDAVHGGQQLRLFNAHYDEYGFQPIVVFDGGGRFITAVLRPAKRPGGKEIKAFLRPAPKLGLREEETGCQPRVAGSRSGRADVARWDWLLHRLSGPGNLSRHLTNTRCIKLGRRRLYGPQAQKFGANVSNLSLHRTLLKVTPNHQYGSRGSPYVASRGNGHIVRLTKT